MTVSAQVIGHGSSFELGSGSGTITYVAIEGVMSIDFGSSKVDAVDNTDMTTTGNTRTSVPGMATPGDCSVKLNVIPGDTSQAALKAVYNAGIQPFKVTYPGAVRTRTFSGIITSFDESIPDDKLPTFTVKIQITGPITDS